MKIVYLIGELGVGGSEKQLYLLLKHLNKQSFDLHVVVFNPSQHVTYHNAMREIGVKVYEVPQTLRNIPSRLWFLYQLLLQLKPDIIHSWTVHDNAYAGISGWLAGIRVRWGSVRGSLTSAGFQSLPFLLRWASLRTITKITVNAETLIEELCRSGLKKKKLIIFKNCVDYKKPATIPSLAEYGIKKTERVVGIIGNLRHVKNHAMFIEGMASILAKKDDVRAIIVGQTIPNETELPQMLNKIIERFGLQDKVILTGFRPDTSELMHRFSIFCLTSNSEGTPNAILEAMTAGVPVVATRVGGIPNIVEDNVTGLLIPPGDVQSFTTAVQKLLDNPLLAKQMGEAGRKEIENQYTCQTVAAHVETVYKNALSGLM